MKHLLFACLLTLFCTNGLSQTVKTITSENYTTEAFDYNGGLVGMYASPMSMIKGVLLLEYNSGEQHRLIDEISDSDILT